VVERVGDLTRGDTACTLGDRNGRGPGTRGVGHTRAGLCSG